MRKVAIISNYQEPQDDRDFIDGCDEVLRFSHCIGIGDNTGTKTTGWITRSHCSYTKMHYAKHGHLLRRMLLDVSTTYIVHGCYDSFDFINTVPYDERVVSQFRDDMTCVSVPIGDLLYLHPSRNPTIGLMFLLWVLRSQIFANDKVFLMGFDFTDIPSTDKHSTAWEKSVVDKWVEHGYFHRLVSTTLKCVRHIT